MRLRHFADLKAGLVHRIEMNEYTMIFSPGHTLRNGAAISSALVQKGVSSILHAPSAHASSAQRSFL